MKTEIWITSLGSVASTLCFIYEIYKFKSRKHKAVAVAILVILTCLAVFLGTRYYSSIKIETFRGNFKSYSEGKQEIFFPAPFQNTPYLKMELKSPGLQNTGPKIVEQRPDGFFVILDFVSDKFEWVAKGTLKKD